MILTSFIETYTTRKEEKKGKTVYSGFTLEPGDSLRLPGGFQAVKEWWDGDYRMVWKHDGERATITYCEGDIVVAVMDGEASYQDELKASAAFYTRY